VGIVGFGRIGQNLFRYCKIFGANVKHIFDPRTVRNGCLEELFEDSDIVLICCSLTEVTYGMVDYSLLRRLRRDAILVNTSRGEVLVEKDLERILLERPDIRVGLDVLGGEIFGLHLASPLLQFSNVTITPHQAGVCYESQEKAARISLRLLTRFLAT
jgi:phosphoglycerate dehydrogenase-like enzyme